MKTKGQRQSTNTEKGKPLSKSDFTPASVAQQVSRASDNLPPGAMKATDKENIAKGKKNPFVGAMQDALDRKATSPVIPKTGRTGKTSRNPFNKK